MSEETERITILLQARDKDMQRVIDRNNKLIARFERDATKATTASAKNIERNLSRMDAAFVSLARGGVAAIGVAVASLASGALRNAINSLGDLADQANRIGIDVESFQGLQRGFQLAGVEASQFGASLEMFTQRIGEAAEGAGPLAEALRKNGIAIRDQNGEVRPSLDLLRDFAGVMQNTATEAERMALANDAFGRSGRALSDALAGGGTAIDDMITSAREGGYVLDAELIARGEELGDKFDDLTLKAGNFFKTIAVGAGEGALGLKMFVEDIIALYTEIGILEERLREAPVAMQALGITLENVGSLTDNQVEKANDLVGGYDLLARSALDMADQLQYAANGLEAMGETNAAEAIRQIADVMKSTSERFSEGAITGDQMLTVLDQMSGSADGLFDALAGVDAITFGGVTGALASFMSVLTSATRQANALRLALPGASAAANTPAASGPAGGPVYTAPIAPVAPGRPEARPLDIDFGYSGPASTGSGSSGGGSSPREAEPEYWDELVQSVQDAQDQLEAFNEAADAGADKMSDLFMSILDGSKSAREALSDLLIELAQVQLKSGLLGLFDNLGGGSGGGILSAFGSAFGGGRAKGGSVLSGKTYLVGEQGPKLFSPGSAGMITPNHKLGGGSGGSVDVRVWVDQNGNWQAAVERISSRAAGHAVESYDRQKYQNARATSGDRRRVS